MSLRGAELRGIKPDFRIKEAEKECPEPPPNPPGKRGRVPKTKERNLLERLRDYEDDVLRFITKYVSTCGKHDISSADALKMLFEGQTPGFMLENV
jgi:hypothetical protein